MPEDLQVEGPLAEVQQHNWQRAQSQSVIEIPSRSHRTYPSLCDPATAIRARESPIDTYQTAREIHSWRYHAS
jgi:hypothetical protein